MSKLAVNDQQAALLRLEVEPFTSRDGSVQQRFEDFFAANPDEELTYADICVKFGVSAQRAREMTMVAKKHIELETAHVVRMAAKGRAA